MFAPPDYQEIASSDPSLKRGRVECRHCGTRLQVDSGQCLQNGWPTCCGETMTLLSAPKEAVPLKGYEPPNGEPRQVDGARLQKIRDTVDPIHQPLEFGHECERCAPCLSDGHFIDVIGVRALLEHIDHLQGQLDKVDQGFAAAFDEG